MIVNEEDADSLEYAITLSSFVLPSERLMSLYPSVVWVSTMDQMNHIDCSVESILIQGGVGRQEKSFHLSNLPSLVTLEMGGGAFCFCHSVVFESLNNDMSDE